MNLHDLAAKLSGKLVNIIDPNKDLPLEITSNSSSVRANSIFIAIHGQKEDGHHYIARAFELGAVLAIVEQENALNNYPGIVVQDTRAAISRLAFYASDQAAAQISTFAFTGTNGKTTSNWLLYHALKSKFPAMRIGTLGVEAGYKDQVYFSKDSNLTTPDSIEMHGYYKQAATHGVKYSVIEASSHALHQKRIDDLPVQVGLFTNLTRDHLDYHPNVEAYFKAKLKLFELIKQNNAQHALAVVNNDCEFGRKIIAHCRKINLNCLSYGFNQGSDILISDFQQEYSGSRLYLNLPENNSPTCLKSAFIGHHNALNLAGVFTALRYYPSTADLALAALQNCPAVPGRLQSVPDSSLGIYIDYAHSPDALENVLNALRPLCKGKLWVVFGCGGDRDRGKRPQMAKVAKNLADCVVVTSDNPRTEDPQQILNDILNEGTKVAFVDVDRRKAIHTAIKQATAGDLVLIAGKGHENYQIIGTNKIHFSDYEEAELALKERS